jgi:uracil-DNA glycosylase family 4
LSDTGFFDLKDISIIRGDEIPKKKDIISSGNCEDCKLYKTCTHPKIPIWGYGRKKIMIILDFPSENEDLYGLPFSGSYGNFLKDVFNKKGINIERDCWVTYANRCRPIQEKLDKLTKPTIQQQTICRKFLQNEIKEKNPKIIIPMGDISWDSLIGYKLDGRAVKGTSYRDWCTSLIPEQEMKKWVCPIYSPFDIMINQKDEGFLVQWKNNIDEIVKLIEKEIPLFEYDNKIKLIFTEEEAIFYIKWAMEQSIIAFDYETTGKKPHRFGQRILCVSISNGKESIAFPFFYTDTFLFTWREFLKNKNVRKIAHNLTFEHQWSKVQAGKWVEKWQHDCMLAAHVMNSNGIKNLKFLTYKYFGIGGYDSVIDQYIEADKDEEDVYGGNAINKMEYSPLRERLYYCAQDSLFEFWLYQLQINTIDDHTIKGFRFFMESQPFLTKVQNRGLNIAIDTIEKAKNYVNEKLVSCEKAIYSDPILNKWDGERKFKFTSSKDIGHLIYDICKTPIGKLTDGNAPSTSKNVIAKIDIPIIKNILEYKKWEKAKGTYIHQIEREIIDGKIRAFINLGIPVTFRSSIDSPSLQNIPKRDKDIMHLIRSLIIPSKGRRIIDYDFKSVEVGIAACYCRDKNLLNYVIDSENTDMHRDVGMILFFMSKEELPSLLRYYAKNKFVFPEFYGSYYKQVAPDIWDTIDNKIKQHLYNHGIQNYRDFEKHVEEIEYKFWNIQFPEYKEWREKQWYDYCKKGYIDSLTGFRYYAPMDRKTVVNYPIQGSAFHVLLWSMKESDKDFMKEGLQSEYILEIHDDQVVDCVVEEEEIVDQIIYKNSCIKVKEHWNFIDIPLMVEKERSAIDGNWAELEECGYLKGTVI